MNEVKPPQFNITIKGDKAHVSRHLEFVHGVINLDLNFAMASGVHNATVLDLHVASLKVAIQHLQSLLDATPQEKSLP